MRRRFRQVDVFSSTPYLGNPVAVVLDADGIDDEAMQRLARWTNLSETTFVLPPSTDLADYRVRIFTPVAELPFAGHPILGTCHAWLEAGGRPRRADTVVQETILGPIDVRRTPDGLAFSGPPLIRSGPADEAMAQRIAVALGIERADVLAAEWVDNGPGWVAALLDSADAVLALRPRVIDFDLGVVGPYPAGSPSAFEVRAFFPTDGGTVEDPVTGSFNASVAEWLLASGRATAPYVVSQGTMLGRAGRVAISQDDTGRVWVAGGTVTYVAGEVEI
jgi:PhzF family phenazine biosynthesis protein